MIPTNKPAAVVNIASYIPLDNNFGLTAPSSSTSIEN